jgi:hypothetical protein
MQNGAKYFMSGLFADTAQRDNNIRQYPALHDLVILLSL